MNDPGWLLLVFVAGAGLALAVIVWCAGRAEKSSWHCDYCGGINLGDQTWCGYCGFIKIEFARSEGGDHAR